MSHSLKATLKLIGIEQVGPTTMCLSLVTFMDVRYNITYESFKSHVPKGYDLVLSIIRFIIPRYMQDLHFRGSTTSKRSRQNSI